MDIVLIDIKWIDMVKANEYFPKPKSLGGKVKVEYSWICRIIYNYVTKADLTIATDVDTSKLAKKVDLASLKSEIDKLDIGKLETTPVHLSELNYGVKNEIVKKIVKVVRKVNAFQTTNISNLVKQKCIWHKN